MHIMRYFWNLYKHGTLFENYRHMSLSRWSDKWRRHFYGMDVKFFLTFNTSGQEITVRKLKIPRPDFGLGLYATRTIGIGEILGCYYRYLIYTDLIKEGHRTKTYGKEVMQVTAETFEKCALSYPRR